MIGYRNAPEENSNAFVNGWLRTGDLAYYDDRGLIFIKDRVKEIIKVIKIRITILLQSKFSLFMTDNKFSVNLVYFSGKIKNFISGQGLSSGTSRIRRNYP